MMKEKFMFYSLPSLPLSFIFSSCSINHFRTRCPAGCSATWSWKEDIESCFQPRPGLPSVFDHAQVRMWPRGNFHSAEEVFAENDHAYPDLVQSPDWHSEGWLLRYPLRSTQASFRSSPLNSTSPVPVSGSCQPPFRCTNKPMGPNITAEKHRKLVLNDV